MEEKVQGHALVLPFPAQSHVNPMLQFSKRLVSKGLKATLVATLAMSKSMNLGSSIGTVHLDLISDGFDEDLFASSNSVDSHQSYFTSLRDVGSQSLAGLIRKYENSLNPITCLIYEPFMPWALDVGKQFGLFVASFFTQPCSVEYIYHRVHRKLLELPISSTPISIPGLPLLEHRDLPMVIGVPGSYPLNFGMLMDQFSNLDQADCVLINTFYKLEEQVVDLMSQDCPVLTIGPTVPSFYLDKSIRDDETYGLDFWTVDKSKIFNWLNTKPIGSVVYVAFGSLVEQSEKQLEELAYGLKESNFHFLWLIRPLEEAKLPKTFKEEVAETGKGLIVNWGNQVKILSHEAVGCFLTHCGWNSTIEALSLGVPMVAIPVWSDEPINAKFVEDVWKVGLRVKFDDEANGIFRKEEIERCIKQVMEGDQKGRELKDNAKKWKVLAMEAVSEGGTSDRNIDELLLRLINYHHPVC
ncbi:hypothetical protein K2173_018072 [Erythroxylum novogranatense]|uniref:Glycosyltransferase n=1 Tax=Erythroxylum novogranatense TaxID=1862640 RepID=A0AAV8TVR2_9ROSI|nr:hypothetical protein K2173_018072 [Erythroxylum novogranatense]